jgi:hypothetical protein
MGEESKADALDWALRDPGGSLDRLEERARRFAVIARAWQDSKGDSEALCPRETDGDAGASAEQPDPAA